MKKWAIIILFFSTAFNFQIFAEDLVSVYLAEIYDTSSCKKSSPRIFNIDNDSDEFNLSVLPKIAKVRKSSRANIRFQDVTLSEPGTLATVLGDKIYELDSLVVRGKVDDSDIYTMWKCSFYGGLSVLNLEYSVIQDNRLPRNAFWYQSEQYTPGDDYFYSIPLRRIILPEGLVELGEFACMYAVNLETINFPTTLREIKRRCFSDCQQLNVNPLIIPEGVEYIGNSSFVNCQSLSGKVVLPSTIKTIGSSAFFQSKITECNFPEGLIEVGDAAFYSCRLKEAILPNSCLSFPGDSHFALNIELERARIPEGLKMIPESFLDGCEKMYECTMPNSVETIGYGAFWQCASLKELILSPNLKSIEKEGLYYCKGLNSIRFPATLEILGAESCLHWKNIKEIYCAAQTPPTCMHSTLNPGNTPWGRYGSDFENRTRQDIPIYVPIGTADQYRNAWGWNYFSNYIEIDFSSVIDVIAEDICSSNDTYDIMGMKVTNLIPGHLYIKNGKKFIKQ